MTSETIENAIGMIDDKYITASYIAPDTRRGSRWKQGAVAAVLLCLIAVAVVWVATTDKKTPHGDTVLQDNSSQEGESTESSAPSEGSTEQPLPVVIWTEGLDTEHEESYDGDNPYVNLSDDVFVYKPFYNVISAAADTDCFAFRITPTVSSTVEEDAELVALRTAASNAKAALDDAYNNARAYYEGLGMHYAEARQRAYAEKGYLAAKDAYDKAGLALCNAWAEKNAEVHSKLISTLEELGFTRLYGGEADDYLAYLCATKSLCVMSGTKAQILALANTSLPFGFGIYAASEKGTQYTLGDHDYATWATPLCEDSKLSVKTEDAFGTVNGQTVRVVVYYAISNEYTKEELDRAGYTALGFKSYADFQKNIYNLTAEQMDKYIDARNRLLYNIPEKEQILNSLLKDGEFVSFADETGVKQDYFLADLTYQRALELSADKSIAYIALPSEVMGMKGSVKGNNVIGYFSFYQ